jgi:hypothetical protein
MTAAQMHEAEAQRTRSLGIPSASAAGSPTGSPSRPNARSGVPRGGSGAAWDPTSPVVTPESPPIRRTSTEHGMSVTLRCDHQRPERGEALGHRFYGGYHRRCGDEDRAVYKAKFMLPLSFSEAAAAEKYMAHLQHNMPGWRPSPSPRGANGSRPRCSLRPKAYGTYLAGATFVGGRQTL